MNRSKRPHEKPQIKQPGRRKPSQSVRPAEALDTVETRKSAREKLWRAAILDIIDKVNDYIREKGDGVSADHHEIYNSAWKEQAEFSKYLCGHYLAHIRGIQFIKENRFSKNLNSYYHQMLVHASEADKPVSDVEKQEYEKIIKQHFLSQPEKICSLTDLFLSQSHDDPIVNGERNLEILQLTSCFYGSILPALDKVYPLFNKKFDASFAILTNTVGRQIAMIKREGKYKDQPREAVNKKKEYAQKRTDLIGDELLNKIAEEKNNKIKNALIREAGKRSDLGARAIEKRVKDHIEKKEKEKLCLTSQRSPQP